MELDEGQMDSVPKVLASSPQPYLAAPRAVLRIVQSPSSMSVDDFPILVSSMKLIWLVHSLWTLTFRWRCLTHIVRVLERHLDSVNN